MPRWYAAFSCRGRAQVVLEHISRKIRQDNLGQFVPRVCFEKRPHGQFYFCLAIDSLVLGEPPAEISGLLRLPYFSNPVRPAGRSSGYEVLTREQIKQFMGAEFNVEDYTRRIRYQALLPPPVEDPFGALPPEAAPDNGDAATIADRTSAHTRLLVWMSATGSGSQATFQNAALALDLVCNAAEARRLMRRLRLLGHVETSADGAHWSIAPPVLARLALAGDPEFVLCGGRDVRLLEALGRCAWVEENPQPAGLGPAAIIVHGEAEPVVKTVRDAGTPVQVVDGVAGRLAAILPSIADWPETLPSLAGVSPTLFDLRWFNGEDFVEAAWTGRGGLYELWEPAAGAAGIMVPRYTLFFDAARERWLRGDWYGLRFLALTAADVARCARYDAGSGRLAVPEEQRWPEVYERAAVLAAGRLPRLHGGWLIYEGVTEEVTEALATKLDVNLEEDGPDA